uniref:Uncharacterized protein n=1 Tax=viral metagenome TaxID=1070528 RepID=A0A6M3IX94_9ZZZZ
MTNPTREEIKRAVEILKGIKKYNPNGVRVDKGIDTMLDLAQAHFCKLARVKKNMTNPTSKRDRARKILEEILARKHSLKESGVCEENYWVDLALAQLNALYKGE